MRQKRGEIKMDQLIDARGLACPQPVVKAKSALKGLKEGRLEVLVDNDIAVQNLLKLAAYLNYQAESKKEEEKLFRVWFSVKEGQKIDILPADLQNACESCISDDSHNRNKNKIVVLSSDCMGAGDEALGRVLMKGFVYALTELENLPGTILLYNSGARLSVTDSDSVEDLKLLEAQGVEIMTCGTCLKHYGLEEKLAVGTVTNMYMIAEKLTGAASIIRP